MLLDYDQAIAALANVTTEAQLMSLIRQIRIDAPGDVTLLYSGKLPQFDAKALASAAQGDFRLISNPDAARFLDLSTNLALAAKIATIFESDPSLPDTKANNFLWDGRASHGAGRSLGEFCEWCRWRRAHYYRICRR